MVWQLTVIVVPESLECALEVLLQHARVDDLLSLLSLRTCLSIVLAHVFVVGCAKANDALLALVAYIDSDEHGLLRDFGAEVQVPQVSAKLGVDLSEDVDVDAVVELLDGLARHELGDHGAVGVDFVFQSGIQVLLLDGVGHDDQEKVQVFGLFGLLQLFSVRVLSADVFGVVVVDGLLESFNIRLVAQLNNVSIVDVNVEPSFLRELVESVVKIFAMLHVLLKAEDSPLAEVDGLLHDGAEDLRIVQGAETWLGLLVVEVGVGLENFGSLEDFGLNLIRLQADVQVPLLDLFGVRDHLVELLDAGNSLVGLLEEALPDFSHDFLVLPDLVRDAHQGAQFWWQVDVLSFLPNFEQRLIHRVYFDPVGRQEVVDHVGSGLLVAVVEDILLRVHVPLYLVHFVSPVWAVLGHYDGALELPVDEVLVVSFPSVLN